MTSSYNSWSWRAPSAERGWEKQPEGQYFWITGVQTTSHWSRLFAPNSTIIILCLPGCTPLAVSKKYEPDLLPFFNAKLSEKFRNTVSDSPEHSPGTLASPLEALCNAHTCVYLNLFNVLPLLIVFMIMTSRVSGKQRLRLSCMIYITH